MIHGDVPAEKKKLLYSNSLKRCGGVGGVGVWWAGHEKGFAECGSSYGRGGGAWVSGLLSRGRGEGEEAMCGAAPDRGL